MRTETNKRLYDQLTMFSDAGALRGPVYRLTDAIQDFKPAEQLLSLVVALELLCATTGIPKDKVLTIGHNITHDVDGPFSHQIAALKDYAKGELLGGY